MQNLKHILESIDIKEDTKKGIKKGNKHTPNSPQEIKNTRSNMSNPSISIEYKQNKEVVFRGKSKKTRKRGIKKEKKV